MIVETRERPVDKDLRNAIRHYLQDKFDFYSLQKQEMKDAATQLLMMVAKDFELKRGQNRPDHEYKEIVDKEIEQYLNADNSKYMLEGNNKLFSAHE